MYYYTQPKTYSARKVNRSQHYKITTRNWWDGTLPPLTSSIGICSARFTKNKQRRTCNGSTSSAYEISQKENKCKNTTAATLYNAALVTPVLKMMITYSNAKRHFSTTHKTRTEKNTKMNWIQSYFTFYWMASLIIWKGKHIHSYKHAKSWKKKVQRRAPTTPILNRISTRRFTKNSINCSQNKNPLVRTTSSMANFPNGGTFMKPTKYMLIK